MSGAVFTLKASLYWINCFKWNSVALITDCFTVLFYDFHFKISTTIPDLSHFYWPNFIDKTRENISNLFEICKKKSICSIKMIVNHGSYVLNVVLEYSSWISKFNLALLKLEFNTLEKPLFSTIINTLASVRIEYLPRFKRLIQYQLIIHAQL